MNNTPMPLKAGLDMNAPSLAVSEAGSALLAALLDFIQPVVRVYSVDQSMLDHDSPLTLSGGCELEGNALLKILKRFIVTTVSEQRQRGQNNPLVEQNSNPEYTLVPIDVATPASLPVPQLIRSQELPAAILHGIRQKLYNDMPIRMLAFNSDGSDPIQLLERHELLPRIMRSVRIRFGSVDWDCVPTAHRRFYSLEEHRERTVKQLVGDSTKYAILSHEWIRDVPGDVVYGEWKSGLLSKEERGYLKIKRFCQVATRDHNVVFGWMDTVCINKESSSELDESIRSMFKWYKNAHVCVTYLSHTRELENMHLDTWFTRGWTLQELLAPRNIVFYTEDWQKLTCDTNYDKWGRKLSPCAIDKQIQRATSLTWSELQLYYEGRITDLPISRIMQLAAARQVTRTEDQVYSLIGLLRVDITIAYGEGSERALLRLMQEVLRERKHLLDVFNHSYCEDEDKASHIALLPRRLSDYSDRSTLFDEHEDTRSWQPSEPIIFTHLGVCISFLLVPALKLQDPNWQEYKPLGAFSGTVKGVVGLVSQNVFRRRTHLYLLDQSLFNTTQNAYSMVILGIINFVVEDNIVDFPTTCFSLPMKCHGKAGNISPSDHLYILRQPHPIGFQFQYQDPMHRAGANKGEVPHVTERENESALEMLNRDLIYGWEPRYSIPVADLAMHGMQLVTRYM